MKNRHFMFRLIVFFATLFFLLNATSCKEASLLDPIQAELGVEFDLAFNQKVFINDENLNIQFTEVLEDSHCPKNAICIWQGRIVVNLLINETEFEISTPHGSQATHQFETYNITFNGVSSTEVFESTLPSLESYIISLLVEKI